MVVTYGEALVDMIQKADGRFSAVLGGAVCNFTVAVARQGKAATYLNPLSDDSFGDGFARMLADAGVRLGSPERSTRPTSLAVVTLDAGGSPSYTFHREAVADRDIAPERASAAQPAAMRVFQTGALALVPDDLDNTLAVMTSAAGADALIAVDANMRPLACRDLDRYAAGVRRALARAHLIKVSEEDLEHLGYTGVPPEDAARALLDLPGVGLVALTLGAEGAVLLSRQGTVRVGTPADLPVADTVGCGDCFLAGLVVSLEHSGALTPSALDKADLAVLERAARYAVATASLNAMRDGCNPPTADEVARFLAA
ncbi:PfkB family carbohydrate kinase [Pseudoduganella namucuonensis]|uniref:Fructokinase n=1 Tax=Pseudoduganella namucuonensis TaxID=1035707 RepID=A0A1I7LB81_9BURK|nr:PfkB family carbohydrate kinase [Pseudoduganella namucuonensis]SFV06950.1 fructokinase [Pseudoduganella namucuonensis]